MTFSRTLVEILSVAEKYSYCRYQDSTMISEGPQHKIKSVGRDSLITECGSRYTGILLRPLIFSNTKDSTSFCLTCKAVEEMLGELM